jgi:hypothetical protein
MLGKKQSWENPAAQSHGSKVERQRSPDRQRVKIAGMMETSSLLNLTKTSSPAHSQLEASK